MAQENETKNFREFYDAVIVGAGPAGMFAARTLADEIHDDTMGNL